MEFDRARLMNNINTLIKDKNIKILKFFWHCFIATNIIKTQVFLTALYFFLIMHNIIYPHY